MRMAQLQVGRTMPNAQKMPYNFGGTENLIG